ncbi:hypothetical protein AWC38_SpisGene20150 [Stylophora pistillata]|uniref:Uncharacterized protein n=1 Tax=Stylophora pistillata TaxID=50429 RepID=A0A2B4RDB4_STYPI|nr:hypothetical protein AWC38_SpisGene20150 [Stylophora pistillata]
MCSITLCQLILVMTSREFRRELFDRLENIEWRNLEPEYLEYEGIPGIPGIPSILVPNSSIPYFPTYTELFACHRP